MRRRRLAVSGRNRALRWLATGSALACIVAYVLSAQWRVGLERGFVCTDPGFRASGDDLELGFSSGSAALYFGPDPISTVLSEQVPGPPLRREGLTTAHEWRWYCYRRPRWTADVLPSLSKANGVDVRVPFWIPALVLGAWAGLLWRRHIGLRDESRCKGCGYDRRGLVGGAEAKCPECGKVPTK
jgi:hypothetical protein